MKHRIFTVLYQDERGVDVTFSVDMTDERYAVVGIGSKDGKCRVAGFKLPQERFLTLVEMIAEAAGETAPESSVTSAGMMAQVRGPATACTAAAGPCANTWIGGGDVLDISMSPVESPSTTPKSPACVYRYYDGSGTLLYVGVTKRGITRNLEHASHKEWWPFVSRQEVDHFPTYREALDCERDLIVACRPPFNKQHNAQHKEMRAAYLRLAQSADNSECESFTSLYNLLGHALPLRRVVESGHDDRITFVTDPRHAVVARTVHLDRPASIRPAGDGANLGVVRTIAKYGQHAILRGRLKDAALPVDGAVLRLKVVSLKKPITTRATIVELRPLLGMDGAE